MDALWMEYPAPAPRPALEGAVSCQCAVIGGGLAGILTAWRLREAGIEAVVLEARRLGGGQTGRTTAKITAQHGPIYGRLLSQFGPEGAGQYARANLRAVEDYRRLVDQLGLDCDFQDCPSYLFSQAGSQAMEDEARAARQAGLEARFTTRTQLPFPVAGAVRLDRQARFHPLKLLYALARQLPVYEHTPVLRVKGGEVETPHGVVKARYVVFACHFPFPIHPGWYFLRLHQARSYVLALEGAAALDGCYLGVDPGGLSFRPQGEFLLLGGAGHRTGQDRGHSYETLSQAARRLYPGSAQRFRWSAQDCVSLDGVPYIGPFAPSEPRWFVATGFGKWGMTSAMAAANIISGAILGRPDPDGAVFSPRRRTWAASAKQLAVNGAVTAQSLAKSWLLPHKRPADAPFPLPPRCPHLGCQLVWNADEGTWDCPCHGSRFQSTGALLDGPAQRDLDGPR